MYIVYHAIVNAVHSYMYLLQTYCLFTSQLVVFLFHDTLIFISGCKQVKSTNKMIQLSTLYSWKFNIIAINCSSSTLSSACQTEGWVVWWSETPVRKPKKWEYVEEGEFSRSVPNSPGSDLAMNVPWTVFIPKPCCAVGQSVEWQAQPSHVKYSVCHGLYRASLVLGYQHRLTCYRGFCCAAAADSCK